MPSLKTIRKRIASVKSTQKITRAMKMVAGARLNRAQQRITALRPYAVKTREAVHAVSWAITEETTSEESGAEEAQDIHPLLVRRPEKSVLLLVVTSDRGLCGAFNTNIGKMAEAAWKKKEEEGRSVFFATIGRKGRDYLTRRKGTVVHHFARGNEDISTDFARTVAIWLTDRYRAGEFDSIHLIFSEFRSAITQRPTDDELLPLAADSSAEPKDALVEGLIFEPDKSKVLDRLLPMYLEMSVYRALLESQAGFLGAQMTAMDAATRNAKDMIARLTLQYNRARQAAITKELMEIIGGAEALKG